MKHAEFSSKLPAIYRDPFDRTLIAQASCEALPLMTTDRQIRRYNLQVIEP
jgi:PIN domain nuclease of toxin-antitoxin system